MNKPARRVRILRYASSAPKASFDRCGPTCVPSAGAASILAVLIAMAIFALPAAARAEYRCTAPERLAEEEQRACELAKQNSPVALIHFVNSKKGTYDMSLSDYVSVADLARWSLARHNAEVDRPLEATAVSDMTGARESQVPTRGRQAAR
jgi:hypothetical protein